MAISGNDEAALFGAGGFGKIPVVGGPATLLLPSIAQTAPIENLTNGVTTGTTGVMSLSSVFLISGQRISNINFISSNQAEATGTHLWFALYDDGRGSTTAGQLALLAQTLDQTGAAAFAANTNLGLSVLVPYTTTYTGIYYVAFMCTAGTLPSLRYANLINASIQVAASAGAFMAGKAGSGLTNMAPNPSGVVTSNGALLYSYLS
jgi:hypothetical protein